MFQERAASSLLKICAIGRLGSFVICALKNSSSKLRLRKSHSRVNGLEL